jgi:hypothetical protein
VEDLFSDDFKIHDPEAKWISGESRVLAPEKFFPLAASSPVWVWWFVSWYTELLL